MELDLLSDLARRVARRASVWYETTPPAERVTWGGLMAAASLGFLVFFERGFRLRRGRIFPQKFSTRFLERLKDGKLDRGKALDYCELNPSPSSRVALAAVRRWGRPVTDLERAVSLAQRVEVDLLRRNVATLRRVATLTPLLGLLGTLVATGGVLSSITPGGANLFWGRALASALLPLTTGVAFSVLALVAYDGLAARVEALIGDLEKVGAETIDAIALAVPLPGSHHLPGSGTAPRFTTAMGPATRTPHQVRLEVPQLPPRPTSDEEDHFEGL
ncbi:MAG: hypothetical protein NVSMB9_03890 [Isosphaeraceae bacterium]